VTVIRQSDIDAVFTVLDRLGISREAVVIPLKRTDPGGVRIRPDEKLEIVVPASRAVEDWLPELEAAISALKA
jgi:hypothetical protein